MKLKVTVPFFLAGTASKDTTFPKSKPSAGTVTRGTAPGVNAWLPSTGNGLKNGLKPKQPRVSQFELLWSAIRLYVITRRPSRHGVGASLSKLIGKAKFASSTWPGVA